MGDQRGVYTVVFTDQTVAAASGDYDLFEITPADDKPVEIVGLLLSVRSETGDAAEEILSISFVRGNATSGNGTATTPRPLDSRDQAALFTAEVLATTPASAGTAITSISDGMNVRVGYPLILPGEMRPMANQADTMICVRLNVAVADDVTMSGTLFVKEV